MKPKFYYTFFIACFFVLNGFAQKQNVYFLKNDGRNVPVKDSADFIRIVREPDSGTVLYNVLEYYLNGNTKMVGKSSTIYPITLEGESISYYQNKKRKQVSKYEIGELTADTYDYYPNGNLYRVIAYVNDNYKIWFDRQTVKAVFDSLGNEMVKNGNGHYQVFDKNYKRIEEEGGVKDGRRDGLWKGSIVNKLTYIEEYADGKFINGTSTDENGHTINYMVKEALPTFRGGETGFGDYLSRSIRYPMPARKNRIQGRVIVSFAVEKDGQLSDFKILRDIGGGCGEEAVRVLQQSPKWNPGIQHGVPVRVAYTMPINFTLGR
ncbi:energy transducer TonB [uncultured Mucilaginibacter sp.]|uniref:energy transducer TonB n=1 Tax=uncultured Mucilaginibacter sp. TaxID=797541 RepID=UPI0026250F46|nr:energy transducer TonB [uncultured Mucilaginibacter sp.]